MTVWRRWRVRIFMILAILGPGFITANVDNDSGGIFTYSQAGAQFGYSLLWTMIPITLALIVVQEMCARMGAVTGKGLSDLIREEFGLRVTFVMMVLLVIVNYGNVVSEFSGIAGSMELFHISKYLSVPVCAALVWILVVKGDYKVVEKVFLCASVIYIAYIIAGVKAGPNWHEALVETVKLPSRSAWNEKGYVYMVVAVIGTTISPWMQFYLQSSLVDKGVTIKNYAKTTRMDVIVGSFFTDIVGWFIVVACAATLFAHGAGPINEAADAASAMLPMAGQYAFILFAAGLFNASLFAASILPLSTAYTVCEGLGVESGCCAGAEFSLCEGDHPLAGAERRSAAGGDGVYAEADQQARADGEVYEYDVVQLDRVCDGGDRDRAFADTAMATAHRRLMLTAGSSLTFAEATADLRG